MDKDDQTLITDYLEGNDEALAGLISRYLKPVYNFAYRLAGNNKEEAEDITQETFFKMWRNLKKYRPSENFKTWLFTIARNTAYDRLRKKKSKSSFVVFSDFDTEGAFFEESLADTEPIADEIFILAETRELLMQAISELSPQFREVLILHYDHELTFDEIGKILHEPPNTVKSRHRRAIEALRSIFDAPKAPQSSYKEV
jgi:RNA polymerase sigma-70 factor (ECF subfamily)